MMRIIVTCLLNIIIILALPSCGTVPNSNSVGLSPTPMQSTERTNERNNNGNNTNSATAKIKYIVHDRNCALRLGEGVVTDLSFRRIENPWRNSGGRVPVMKPVIKASCGCFEREYPNT